MIARPGPHAFPAATRNNRDSLGVTMYKYMWIAALAVGALSACDQIVGPDSGLAPMEVAELSNALIQDGLSDTADTTTTAASVGADGLAWDVTTSTTEFSRTHACPLGGEVTMEGTRERTRDTETRTGTLDVTATRTFVDCARPLADSSVTITLNGEVTLTAHREWQAGSWNGPQDVTLVGSVDWATDDDRSGTCEIDIEATFDAETHTRTVTGTVCGEDVSAFAGWTFGTMGQGPMGGHGHSGPGPHGDGMGGETG
jgi:hypothetical protein